MSSAGRRRRRPGTGRCRPRSPLRQGQGSDRPGSSRPAPHRAHGRVSPATTTPFVPVITRSVMPAAPLCGGSTNVDTSPAMAIGPPASRPARETRPRVPVAFLKSSPKTSAASALAHQWPHWPHERQLNYDGCRSEGSSSRSESLTDMACPWPQGDTRPASLAEQATPVPSECLDKPIVRPGPLISGTTGTADASASSARAGPRRSSRTS